MRRSRSGRARFPIPRTGWTSSRSSSRRSFWSTRGNFTESEKCYRELLRLEPDVSWHYIGLAILLARDRRVGDGIEVLKGGLRRLPDSTVLMSRLASFYMRVGNFKEAFAMSQATLKRDPRHLDALVIAGWSEDMQGRLEGIGRVFREGPEDRAGEQVHPAEICLCPGGPRPGRGGRPDRRSSQEGVSRRPSGPCRPRRSSTRR